MDNNFDFKEWIRSHKNEEYEIVNESDDVIKLKTEYGEASINFTSIENQTIVEFSITAYKDNSSVFYLHFELNDEDHCKELYDEMVQSLIGLKNKKTTRVLLSCSAGLTTSMFAEQLNSTIEMLGLDYHFDAVSYQSIYQDVENYDVILIAPQIRYMLKRLQDTIPDKLVLQIPTAAFASYDALTTINYVKDELEKFNNSKNEVQEDNFVHCAQYDNRILSIVVWMGRNSTKIYYRLYDKCEVIDCNQIIKSTTSIYDLYDIIDIVLLKHKHIDVIGIATPGIVKDNKLLMESDTEEIVDLKEAFEDKYHIKVFAYNNANAAVMGFSLEHPEYQNIIYHSQPFGYGVGGQGIIINGKIVRGKNGIAGEIRYYLRRMQLSDDIEKLALSEKGNLELVTKALLPSIVTVGPEAVAISSQMTPDMNEVKTALSSFIDEDYLPEFYFLKDVSNYMLSGITKLCVEYLKK
ncbi:MAG: ROK family protein [Thomasclavelia sp.]|nr:ROK family protein [Thomasclavelia sp.]